VPYRQFVVFSISKLNKILKRRKRKNKAMEIRSTRRAVTLMWQWDL
jgi:hypothetical protein